MIDTTSTATRLVCDVIQRVYGDATQTVLDQQAASEIISALRGAGWASLQDVALLIDAAGGEVRVPPRLVDEHSQHTYQVTKQDDWETMGHIYRTRRA